MATSAIAAHTFRLDVKGAEVRYALEAVGVRTVLLKGRAFAELLYNDPASRTYDDVDLLIDPALTEVAGGVLKQLGFVVSGADGPAAQTDVSTGALLEALGSVYGETWVREEDGFVIDLHDGLPQVSADRSAVWTLITGHLDLIQVAGSPTQALDRPASALLVALHAAHHGPSGRSALRDLEHATVVFGPDCWHEARELAAAIDAETVLGVGLGLTPAGRSIAESMGLSSAPSAAMRLLWSGAPWSAIFVESFVAHRGVRARITLLARVLWPTPAALRRGSALARRSRRGLLAAYAVRQFQLLRRLPAGMIARRRFKSSG